MGHQDTMPRRTGDKEFPSPGSENMRGRGSLGISWPHLLGLQMGDRGPEDGKLCPGSHSQCGQSLDKELHKGAGKAEGKS